MSDVLEMRNAGRVRTIVLNRPEALNALSDELAWGLVGAVEEAVNDDSVWVIAITGAGRAFCAGLDLKQNLRGGTVLSERKNHSPLSDQSLFLDDLTWISRFLTVLRQKCDKPIVGGINGVAVGGGLSLALACDIRLMAKSARIMAGYPRIGGSPDGGMSFTLPQAIGYEQAMRFLLENRSVDADEALRLGLVGEVVEDERFEARLAEYCARLAKVSPVTARLTKRDVVKATTAIDLEAHLRLEISNIMKSLGSEDGREAQQAFFEKREATFKGR
ncbi:MAG: enoyl-CoA hydratase/isomerase family protein [Dehalococcoidia bacterium]|nr:enoyl-CoA hydratase [Chloroflexi bacterium CFX7]MCK6563451.1 enoyl-CoA hydratase-related protein [Dehalococcoidia bacterium]NUQ55122.1 enoyl-CoA hydratase/isomerase family protein [Dehalococcoidia bacterium]RIL03218.1 MAG: enoyl-CoA hydratase [bacterium]